MVGRDLITSAQIRSQIKQFEELATAANTFKAKYGYLPADMPPSEASQLGFFTYNGAYAGGTNPTALSRFCGYGDNDGRITRSESFVFWQHLSEAKLVSGSYGVDGNLVGAFTGAPPTIPVKLNSAGSTATICRAANVTVTTILIAITVYGIDNAKFAPTAKIADNTFIDVRPAIPYWDASNIAQPEIHNTSASNFFILYSSYVNSGIADNTTTPLQSYNIDNKMDDGNPVRGTIREWDSDFNSTSSSPCTIGTYPDLRYDLTVSSVSCATAFLW